MGNLKPITNAAVTLGIHPITKMLSVKQGDNVIHMTRDQANGLKSLKDKKNPEINTYTSQTYPTNRFKLTQQGTVLVECTDKYNEATILLNRHSIKGILDYVDANKGKIAWDRDIRRF